MVQSERLVTRANVHLYWISSSLADSFGSCWCGSAGGAVGEAEERLERRALAVGALQGSGSARPGGCGSERFWIGGHLGRIGESICIPAPSVVGLWLLLLSWMASEPRGNAEPPRTPWEQSHVCCVSSDGLESGIPSVRLDTNTD